MKTLKSLFIMGVFSITAMASATTYYQQTGVRAALTKIQTSDLFPHLQVFPFTGGGITVNNYKSTIKLDLYGPTGRCPEGAQCFAPYTHSTIELKIVKVENSRCGTKYIAQTDLGNKIGGAVETLIVNDYSRSVCEVLLPAITVVEYFYSVSGHPDTFGQSFFYANKLTPY